MKINTLYQAVKELEKTVTGSVTPYDQFKAESRADQERYYAWLKSQTSWTAMFHPAVATLK